MRKALRKYFPQKVLLLRLYVLFLLIDRDVQLGVGLIPRSNNIASKPDLSLLQSAFMVYHYTEIAVFVQ